MPKRNTNNSKLSNIRTARQSVQLALERSAAHRAPGSPGCARATPSGSRCSRTPQSSCSASALPTANSSRSCPAPDRAASAAAGSPAPTCTGSVAACAQHHLHVEAELYEYAAALVSIAPIRTYGKSVRSGVSTGSFGWYVPGPGACRVRDDVLLECVGHSSHT